MNLGLSSMFKHATPSEEPSHKIDYRFASELGWSDRTIPDLDWYDNGTLVGDVPPQLLLSVGADILPSELGLTVRETAGVFDPSYRNHPIHQESLSQKGLELHVSNPPRVYEDGRVKLTQNVLGPSVVGRQADIILRKNYGWVRSMAVDKLNTNRGFDFEYTEVYQLDGINSGQNLPLVENGVDAKQTNSQLVSSLITERLQNNSLNSDPKINGSVTDVMFDEQTGELQYTITSSMGSSLIPKCLSDLIISGLLRRTELSWNHADKGEWSVTLTYSIFAQE